MVGLFDSGSGGLNTVRYIKELSKKVDLVYLIDRERAPYGIKTEKELVEITEDNIERLADMGAEKVLIACCTASTVYHLLNDRYKALSIPIIDAVAKEAKNATRLERIGVIATSRTVRSHAFANALPRYEVTELATPELVTLIDKGLSDSNIDAGAEQYIEDMIRPVLEVKVDTLILGCTHFPALKGTVARIASKYGVKHVIDSARIGAKMLISAAKA